MNTHTILFSVLINLTHSLKVKKSPIAYLAQNDTVTNNKILPRNSQPPYFGTVFEFPTAVDSSVITGFFESAEYQGIKQREWWDYRDCCNGWNNAETHVFLIKTTDDQEFEIFVNKNDWPNVSEGSDGYTEMLRHAIALTRIPKIFRGQLNSFALNGDGVGSLGGGNPWTKTMNANLGYTKSLFAPGTIEEFFVHEGCHVTVDDMFKNDPEWIQAQNDDGKFISTYARDFPQREDIAESMPAWMFVRKHVQITENDNIDVTGISDRKILTVIETIPNRLKFFEKHFSEHLNGDSETTTSGTTTETTTSSSISTKSKLFIFMTFYYPLLY